MGEIGGGNTIGKKEKRSSIRGRIDLYKVCAYF